MAVIYNLSKEEVAAIRKAATVISRTWRAKLQLKKLTMPTSNWGLDQLLLEIDVRVRGRRGLDLRQGQVLKDLFSLVQGDGPKERQRRLYLLNQVYRLSQ